MSCVVISVKSHVQIIIFRYFGKAAGDGNVLVINSSTFEASCLLFGSIG